MFSETEGATALVHNEAENPRSASHVERLEDRPFPAVRLALHHRDRAHALHGEDIKNHQCETHERREERAAIRPFRSQQRVAERGGIFVRCLRVEHHSHRGNENFPGRERTDQANANLPMPCTAKRR